jgi:hypothetical protein
MLVVQAEKSTIDINAADLDNFELDVYIYTEPLGGLAEPLKNEPIEVYIYPKDAYDNYVGTDPDGLKTYVNNYAQPPYPYSYFNTTTDSNGFFNATFAVLLANHGVGVFYVVVFYLSTWNISLSFTISSGPAFLFDTSFESDVYSDRDTSLFSTGHSYNIYYSIIPTMFVLGTYYQKNYNRKEVFV